MVEGGTGRSDAASLGAWLARAPLRAVAAGLAVEFVAVLALVGTADALSLPVFYVPSAPARAGSVLGGGVAGYLAVRRAEADDPNGEGNGDPGGDPRTGTDGGDPAPGWAFRGGTVGGALALAALTAAAAGELLGTALWPVVVAPPLAVAAWTAYDRRGIARVLPVLATLVLALVAVGSRLRTGVGIALSAATLVPRVGAYAFLDPAWYGAVLLALSVTANAVGGVAGRFSPAGRTAKPLAGARIAEPIRYSDMRYTTSRRRGSPRA